MTRRWLFGAFLALLPAVTSGSAASDEFSLSMKAVVNPVGSILAPQCTASTSAGTNERITWWVFMPLLKGESAHPTIECGNGVREGPEGAPAPAREGILVQVAVTPRIGSRQDRFLLVEVSTRRQIADGGEVATAPARRTEFYFEHADELWSPAVITTPDEQRRFGVKEVFLRIGAEEALPRVGIAYGSLTIVSSATGANIVLDGGVAGTVEEGGETTLRNVRIGDRLVQLREGSKRGGARVVRVRAGRRALVSLDLQDPPGGAPPIGLFPLGPNYQGYEEYRRDRDGAVVVRVPAGQFLMGNRETEREPLEHLVYVSEFLIDKTEVSWAQYKRFAAATGRSLPPHEPYWGIHDDHPAVFVTWEEAKAHCEWAGARLATEAEWEKAARGTDERMYPWGDEEPTPERAVFRRSWGFVATDPVTAHPSGASPYGALDMGGSNWEWCADWYDGDYYQVSPERDPRGPEAGLAHVVRGGSWDSRPDVLSCSCRSWGHRGYREGDFGFRCAMDPP